MASPSFLEAFPYGMSGGVVAVILGVAIVALIIVALLLLFGWGCRDVIRVGLCLMLLLYRCCRH